MGWTILYIAFGVVALWLLGEVLLQYKARLRWRLVAFCGFLCVVLGVLLPSVPLIGVGTAAFALGQTFVTLSFRRGFSKGWALGGRPGTSRRRRERIPAGTSPLEPAADGAYPGAAGPDGHAPDETPVHGVAGVGGAPGADDGGYPAMAPTAPPGSSVDAWGEPYETAASAGYGGGRWPEQGEQPYADPYAEPYAEPSAVAYASHDTGETYVGYAGPYEGEAQTTGTHGDPLIASGPYAGYPAADPPQEPRYDAPQYAAFPASDNAGDTMAGYATGHAAFYPDTPPTGVWMPGQPEAAETTQASPGYGYPPPEPYQQGDGHGTAGQGYYPGGGRTY